MQQSVARLEALARLMDGAFVVPGTTIRFGLDGIVGAIPVVGDAFDVLFRANMKNVAMLRRHLEKKGYTRLVGGTVIDGEAVRVG